MKKPHLYIFHLFFIVCITITNGQTSLVYDSYGGVKQIKGTATGYFHIEKINGRDILITPEGNGFFSMGVNHTGLLQGSPYPATVTKTFIGILDNPNALASFIISDLKEVGINSMGYHSLPALRQSKVPFMEVIILSENMGVIPVYGGPFGKIKDKGNYADIFDTLWINQMEEFVRKLCAMQKNNPWLIGYYFSDMTMWNVNVQRSMMNGLDHVSFIRSLPEYSAGKKSYINFLKSKYFNIEKFNGSYGLALNCFNNLLNYNFKELDISLPDVVKDDIEFLEIIARQYFSTINSLIKKYDPNHLIFGDRLQPGELCTDNIFKILAEYSDVISIQPAFTKLNIDLPTYFGYLHNLTGKPIIICDHGYRDTIPFEDTYEDQSHIIDYLNNYITEVTQLPYLIGYHRCTYIDRPRHGSVHGFYGMDGRPYQIIKEEISEINRRVLDNVYYSIINKKVKTFSLSTTNPSLIYETARGEW